MRHMMHGKKFFVLLCAATLAFLMLLSGCGKAEEPTTPEAPQGSTSTDGLPGHFEGEDTSYRVLTTAEDLIEFAACVNDYSKSEYQQYEWRLGADIDMTGCRWVPIGFYPQSEDFYDSKNREQWGFRGTFDGQGYRVYGISCKGEAVYCTGFFGLLYPGAVVKNLRVEGSFIGERMVGGIAGGINHFVDIEEPASVQISSCSFQGEVHALNDSAGGIMGASGAYTAIDHCFSDAEVSGCYDIGGIVGSLNNNAYLNFSSCRGTVTGIGQQHSEQEYGLALQEKSNLPEGEIPVNHIGGFVGAAYNGSIYSCYSDVVVKTADTANIVGDFIGSLSGYITDCYYTDSHTWGPGKAYIGNFDNLHGVTKAELSKAETYPSYLLTKDNRLLISPEYGMPVPMIMDNPMQKNL